MKNKIAACSFSGGKDSTLALYYAHKEGFDVRWLVNFISRRYRRSSFHGVPAEFIGIQARCLGKKIIQYSVGKTSVSYEKKFLKMLRKIKKLGAEYFICGDIYLEEHPNWIKRQCDKVGIKLIEPLWKRAPVEVVREFINLGFKARVVSINANLLPKSLVGVLIDKNFLREIKRYNICSAGENGEYHTFVYDGPIFKNRIDILKSEVVFKKTYWSAWFLNIKKVRIEEKYESENC